MDIGLDYAGRSPGAAAVKAAGFDFVARYLSRYTAKTISAAEYKDMTQNGVGVVVVFEDYADQALKGYNQGVADAQFALAQARGIGWPEDRPIYFAVDFDISDAQKPVGAAYMRGAIAVLGVGRVGAYGGYYWIKYCAENGLASYFWQAVAWSGGKQHPRNNLFQRLGGTTVNGTACDINDARTADYGQNNTQGGTMVIPDNDAWFGRFNKLMLQIRGRSISREEFQKNFVGVDAFHMVEVLSDSAEADNATNAGGALINSHLWPLLNNDPNAINPVVDDLINWKDAGQKMSQTIADLQKQIADLGDNPSPDQLAALQKQLDEANKKLAEYQAQQAADTATGNSFLRWLGGILSKLKG